MDGENNSVDPPVHNENEYRENDGILTGEFDDAYNEDDFDEYDDVDEEELQSAKPYKVISFWNVLCMLIGYTIWIFPLTGCFGCHWFFTLRRVYNPLYLCHTFVRLFLICFFNASFWFTRLFVCDYRFMTYPGLIPWHDKPSCEDGEVHLSGDCYGTEVKIFLIIHLVSLGILLILWTCDGCSMGFCELFLNATTRKRRVENNRNYGDNYGRVKNFHGKMSLYKGSCFLKACYGSGILITSAMLAFSMGLFYTWFLNVIVGGFGADGKIQGTVSLVITSLLTILTVASGGVWVFLYCVS